MEVMSSGSRTELVKSVSYGFKQGQWLRTWLLLSHGCGKLIPPLVPTGKLNSILSIELYENLNIFFSEGYKLYIPLHKSSITGRYQVSGLLFLATENRENVLAGLKFFKTALPYTAEDLEVRFHFLVDKDFDYIEVKENM